MSNLCYERAGHKDKAEIRVVVLPFMYTSSRRVDSAIAKGCVLFFRLTRCIRHDTTKELKGDENIRLVIFTINQMFGEIS